MMTRKCKPTILCCAQEIKRLSAELEAASKRAAAAEMAHKLLLRDRDSAIEHRAAQHQASICTNILSMPVSTATKQ